ncbi:PilX N-terminal domain-containing pilus assembly protein [Marichromatium gracile]|uniref:Type IV pilus assembly protein PilX n=1 Tax=Marichromatium gracile TaxID=1048 RepID=A0ABR5VL34_MARGR|nr:PilX N-terminal domain-containing pilus assembly protein [Marichromatium gracile]KXX66175.1 hypothetical protein AY586_06285 [Marichromatium gracile]
MSITHPRRAPSSQRAQRGVALIVSLIFLLVMTLAGVTAMQVTSLQETMASNSHQRTLAFQGAEACLRDAEVFLQAATLPGFDGSTPGLIQPVSPDQEIGQFWVSGYCWDGSESGCGAAASQTCTAIADLTEAARYVIEELAPAPTSSTKFGPLPDIRYYRVTARSLGGTSNARVILQTVYQR